MNKKTEYAYEADVLHADKVTWNRYTSLINAHINRQNEGEDREYEMHATFADAYAAAVREHIMTEGEIPAQVEIWLTRRIVDGEEPEELDNLDLGKINALFEAKELPSSENVTP